MRQRLLRKRVESCLQLIKDVCRRLEREQVHPRIVAQLKRLNELLAQLDHDCVTEADLARIERSTNRLMSELELLFSCKGIGQLYDQTLH